MKPNREGVDGVSDMTPEVLIRKRELDLDSESPR